MEKICVICGGKYEAYDRVGNSAGRGIKGKLKRPHNSKTCSKKCAKVYVQKLNRGEHKKKMFKKSSLRWNLLASNKE